MLFGCLHTLDFFFIGFFPYLMFCSVKLTRLPILLLMLFLLGGHLTSGIIGTAVKQPAGNTQIEWFLLT